MKAHSSNSPLLKHTTTGSFETAMVVTCLLSLLAVPALARDPVAEYGIRVTTGSVVQKGWEKGLVRNEKTLKQWYWSPIVDFTQGTRRNGPPVATKRTHYVKPSHVPFSELQKQMAADSAKAALQANTNTSLAFSPNGSQNNLQGKLIKQPKVASYGQPYSSSAYPSVSADLAQTAVSAKLARKPGAYQ